MQLFHIHTFLLNAIALAIVISYGIEKYISQKSKQKCILCVFPEEYEICERRMACDIREANPISFYLWQDARRITEPSYIVKKQMGKKE